MKQLTLRKLLVSAALCMAALAAPCAEANYFCYGTVDQVAAGPDGSVMAVSAGMGWVYLCHVDSTWNGITPDACKGVLSALLAAKLAGRQVQWAFNDALTCTTHPSWAALTGWYWGPAMID